jgi:hypothetical protein
MLFLLDFSLLCLSFLISLLFCVGDLKVSEFDELSRDNGGEVFPRQKVEREEVGYIVCLEVCVFR